MRKESFGHFEHLQVDGEFIKPIALGKFSSATAGKAYGITILRSGQTAAFRTYADDNGAVLYGAGSVPDLRAGISRMLLTKDNSGGDIRIHGFMGQLKSYDGLWNDEVVSGINGRLEIVRSSATLTLGGNGISAALLGVVNTEGAITVNTSHILAGVAVVSDFKATLTQTGKTVGLLVAKYDTTNWSDSTSRTVWGYGLYIPAGAASCGIMIGDFSSVTQGSGLALSATNTAIVKIYSDDAGAAMTGSLRTLLARTLLTVDHSGDLSVRSIIGQIKFKDLVDLSNGVTSGVEGYIEIAGTSNFGAASFAAGLTGVVEVTTATTITAGGYLAGVAAIYKSAATPTGVCAAFITKAGSTVAWPYGLYMGAGSVVRPILIGASTSDPMIVTSTGTSNMVEVNAKMTGVSGILRGILSYVEFSGTHVSVATNLYAIRGYAKVSGTAGDGSFYSCGVQGKLELSGTISGGKHAAVLAQLNASAGLAGATGGTVYCLWADGMQISANPASALNVTAIGIEMPDAAARFDSVFYVYGGAAYLFDLQNSGVGSGYGALIAQAPGTSTGSLKIRIGAVDYYIPVTTDPTA